MQQAAWCDSCSRIIRATRPARAIGVDDAVPESDDEMPVRDKTLRQGHRISSTGRLGGALVYDLFNEIKFDVLPTVRQSRKAINIVLDGGLTTIGHEQNASDASSRELFQDVM